jgi:hypothetical protein
LSLPPALAALVICASGLVLAFGWQLPFRREVWRHSYWLVLTQILFFPATIAIGVLFHASGGGPHHEPNQTGRWLLDGLRYLSLGLGCVWVYRMKGLRWFAVSLVALQELVVLCAGFIAGMSVSGDWL